MNLHDVPHEQHDTQADLDNVDAEMGRVLEEGIEEAAALAAPAPKVHLTPDDLEGLPEDLMKELGLSESDRKEMLVVELIDKVGGVASINRVLVEIYNATGEVEKRTRLSSRLNRMQRKGLLFSVPKSKGIYATRPVTDALSGDDADDVDDVDGEDDDME